jgi:hypothetical protein
VLLVAGRTSHHLRIDSSRVTLNCDKRCRDVCCAGRQARREYKRRGFETAGTALNWSTRSDKLGGSNVPT